MRNQLNIAVVGLVAAALGFGCLCGGSEPKCEGFVTFEGKEYYGADKNAADAGRNACNNFCIAEDEKYDQYWQEWKETPAADKERIFRGGKLKKVDATSDKGIMEYLYKECAPKCVREANKGKHKLRTSCKG